MKLDLSTLTKEEVNFRKFWRKCFFIFYGLTAFLILAGHVIILNSPEGDPEQLGADTVDYMLFGFLPVFIFYRYAFKKGGTFLLTLYLYIKPIGVLIMGVLIFFFPFPFNLIFFGYMFLVSLFFYVLNWKLRKINKKLILNSIYPDEYILVTKALSEATLQNDLDSFYNSLIQKWPQFEKHSTHLYRQHLQTSLNKQKV